MPMQADQPVAVLNTLPVPVARFPLERGPGVDELLAAFLAGRNPRTLRAYRQGLDDFATFVGATGKPQSGSTDILEYLPDAMEECAGLPHCE